MKNLIKSLASLLPALLFVFAVASPADAILFQSGDNLVLPKEKVINETVAIAGSSLTIDANINGDLFCAGRDIVINGSIKGDVLCAGQNIKVNGAVDGDIRVVGQTIEVMNVVSRNLMVGSQSLNLGPKSNIKGDIMFGVQNVQLGGLMGRDLAGAGDSITISGSLLRNAVVTGTNVSIADTGKIGGNLDYYMEKSAMANIDQKNVKGTILRHDIQTPSKPEMEKQMVKVSSTAMVLKGLFGIISYAILGLALVYFDRKNTQKRISQIVSKPLVSGLIGLAVFIVAPIALFILMVTVVGLPLAFLVIFVYIIALMTASLYPSAIYGKYVMEKIFNKKNASLNWQMVVGVLVLGILSIIPIVGWIFAFVSFCMGLGAIFTSMAPEKA